MIFSNQLITHKISGSLEYIQFKHFNNTKLVKHCITIRKGGVSTEEFSSLNLKKNIGDTETNVIDNQRLLASELEIDYEKLVNSPQPHGDVVEVISHDLKDLSKVDGFITNIIGIPLITYYADCVPLLFLDPVKKVIGNSHAGWRGTVKKIGAKTVHKMITEFGSDPKDILVGVGPSIGPCCFETGPDVVEEFKVNFGDECYINKNGKYYINLWDANINQLQNAGVSSDNIFTSNICTMCNMDYFFSYRGEGGKTGRMGAVIQLV